MFEVRDALRWAMWSSLDNLQLTMTIMLVRMICKYFGVFISFQTLDTLDGVVKSELDWGLILYGEEEEDYLATTEGGSCC